MPTKTEVQIDSKVVFDIGGEVVKPGVYSLLKGSRMDDALVAAGGLSEKADRDWVVTNVNRAELLTDGEKIFIPKVGESEAIVTTGVTTVGKVATKNEKININKATSEELDKLSGVGPALAQRIIDYRVKNGGFKAVEEIKSVSGIGDKMFAKIEDEITI